MEPIETEEKKGTNVHEFWKYYLKLDHDEISEIAHQPKDMIIGCVFNKQVRGGDPRCIYLMTKGGKTIFSPSYGVCYMFNFRGLDYEKYPAVVRVLHVFLPYRNKIPKICQSNHPFYVYQKYKEQILIG